MIFSKISSLFSPNGLTFPGGAVKLENPTELKFQISGEKAIVTFEQHPLLSVEKEITLFGKKITTVSFSRKVSKIVLTSSNVTLELVNFPDFTIDIE